MLRVTFSPTAPINSREVLAGRLTELRDVTDTIMQRGQHAVIYGDRGVGKTSLALVAREVAGGADLFTSFITCDSSMDFTTVWRQVFREISVMHGDEQGDASTYLPDAERLTPDDIRLAFKLLSTNAPVVVFVDEFDTLDGTDARQLFANLVKILSDQALDVTVVFVGVARDVNQLIADHASVQRVLAEVFMPRMSKQEMIDIVERGLTSAGMKVTPAAAERVAILSQGMPTIVHRLGQQAGYRCIERRSNEVTVTDVDSAIESVISRNMESISAVYENAVFTTRPGTLFAHVALACACAPSDDKGFFTSGSLRGPLKAITGSSYQISRVFSSFE